MYKTVKIKNASAIVTCDVDDNIYYDSDILIEGPKIVRIEKGIRDSADEVIDASGKFI